VPPFVIDTNIVFELTRPAPHPAVIAFLNQNSDLLLSVIVFHELQFGIQCARDGNRRAKLHAFAIGLRNRFEGRIIDVDFPIAETAGKLRAAEKAQGRLLAELDAFVAATALVKSATLVTRNTKDFAQLEIPLLNPWETPE
jgi:predicted nucleic acid-binding protein